VEEDALEEKRGEERRGGWIRGEGVGRQTDMYCKEKIMERVRLCETTVEGDKTGCIQQKDFSLIICHLIVCHEGSEACERLTACASYPN
jgi:hypothetical protein